jgi:multiple sugar transport system ATP-binding protein
VARVFLDQIYRQFSPTNTIEAITFEVPDGAFWVLVGPSGCGKSTILRMIAGLETPTAGNLYIGDRQVNSVPARARDVAMVFQNYALYPHMTVAENLGFGLKLRGVDRSTLQQQVMAAAQTLGIQALLDRKPGQLSGGQQQRVALGRAIVRQPQVFLMDEPLSNLDAQLRDETRAELKLLHQKLGITTIYVTHDQVEAMTLADQIVVLNQGKIQQISDPQTLYAQPDNQMVATFLGSPPMNILPARIEGDRLRIGNQVILMPQSLWALFTSSGRLTAVNLGIRPEQVQWIHATRSSDLSPDLPSDLLSEDRSIQQAADQSNRSATLIAIVTVTEPLGREVLVRAELSGTIEPLILQFWATADQAIRVGDQGLLQFKLADLYGFDPETGENLQLQLRH